VRVTADAVCEAVEPALGEVALGVGLEPVELVPLVRPDEPVNRLKTPAETHRLAPREARRAVETSLQARGPIKPIPRTGR